MTPVPLGRLNQIAPLADGLVAAAQATAAATRKLYREKKRGARGATPATGHDTPLWNELVASTAPFLRSHGEKAKLARLLGISRQRLHMLLVAKTAYPDAERTLQLLVWVNARKRGGQPA